MHDPSKIIVPETHTPLPIPHHTMVPTPLVHVPSPGYLKTLIAEGLKMIIEEKSLSMDGVDKASGKFD